MDDEARCRSWIDWNLANYRDHGFGLWVIESLEDGAPLGDCGLTFQEVAGDTMLEIGYHSIEAHRGRGYATEAAAACRDYASDVLGCRNRLLHRRSTECAVDLCRLSHPRCPDNFHQR